MAGAVPPAGQHLAPVCVHQPVGGVWGLAHLPGHPGVQQPGPPGEVHHPGTGKSAAASHSVPVRLHLGRFCPRLTPDPLHRGRRVSPGRGDPQHGEEDHQGLCGVLVLNRVLRERFRKGGAGGDGLHGHGDERARPTGGQEGIWIRIGCF